MTDNHPRTPRDETRVPNKFEDPPAIRRATARALFEGTPGATCEWIAEQVGCSAGHVRRWKAEGRWSPAVKRLPNMAALAIAAANKIEVKMSELGKPLSDEVAASEASKEVAESMAVDIRTQVIDRHRREWAAPRKLAYEAIQSGNFDRAKLAKITSETLTLIQHGECRAYGIDFKAKTGEGGTMIVIDRDGNELGTDSAETSTGTD